MTRSRSAFVAVSRFEFLLFSFVLVLSCGSGYTVVEKHTLVVDLADTTDEVRVLYLFERIIAADGQPRVKLQTPSPAVFPPIAIPPKVLEGGRSLR